MATFPGPSSSLPDEYKIRAIPEDFVRYYAARNIDQLMTLFSEDGRIMSPFRPASQGKMGLRQSFDIAFNEYDHKNLKLNTIYVEVCGTLAFGFGTFQASVKLPTGKRIEDHGKWLVVLRRVGTTWKIVSNCWNTDLPLSTFGG